MAQPEPRIHRPQKATPEPPSGPWGDQDPVTWARATGRLTARSEAFWRSQLASDPVETAKTLQTLAPVLAEDTTRELQSGVWETDQDGHAVLRGTYAPSGPPLSDTPLLDELDRKVFGPSQAEREREQDLAAEASLREQIRAEQEKAAADASIDPSAWDDLFGPGRT